MTASQTYLLGFIILIIGLAGAAYMLAVPPVWIAVGRGDPDRARHHGGRQLLRVGEP
jgi:hypothetical protein